MEESQLATFLWLALTAIALSFLFDCYRFMRKTLRLRVLTTAVADLCFWLLAALIVFSVLLCSNGGEMRLYVFISLALGALFYYRLLSSRAMQCILVGFKALRGIMKAVYQTFHVLIVQPFFYTLRVMTAPLRFFRRKTQFVYGGVYRKARHVWYKFQLFFK
ncbi:spore cortex biosynthesis protein YabQ [Sporomusaceae bacterium BoRhaA]|uniref:spore cortex biosynthesis protein YabQ n=1 Tax=Pelorhabdus rhamnosifermentans TaxID=2772457 RepID=UPI001C05FA4A|nr:spore cortex biosynthesis protein YabQ [Pelorhabdus rhamnosifermentans]MBU2700676.1 spore cortex biosynthesis protein YabQ [Pelorhabdus rhamnosifermentans]